jgi:hypothetical protein
MNWDTALRGIGVVGLVASYYVFAMHGENVYPLVIAVVGVIAIVAPEMIDQLPFGPTK